MTPETQATAAQRLYEHRRLRDALFGADRDGFGEPGWDMLLLLFVRDADGIAVREDELIAAAAVPETIARPYVDWLISRKLAARVVDGDQRYLVTIGTSGRDMLTDYLRRI